MTDLERTVAGLAAARTSLTLFPTSAGYQASVKTAASTGWRVEIRPDPLTALRAVLSLENHYDLDAESLEMLS